MILLKNILVATDFSEASDAAFEYGRELARTFEAQLRVVHVTDNIMTPVLTFTVAAAAPNSPPVVTSSPTPSGPVASAASSGAAALGASSGLPVGPKKSRCG